MSSPIGRFKYVVLSTSLTFLSFSSCLTTSKTPAISDVASTAVNTQQQIIGFAFDWDDNIFNMPTQIMIKNTKNGSEKAVSTAEFALIREKVGVVGTEWADYTISYSPTDGSLRFFGDEASDQINHFQADIDKALSTAGYQWQAPAWNDFVQAMSRSDTAAETSIITAREHAPETIQNALKGLVTRGYIKNVPPLENIWAVGAPSFPDSFTKAFNKAPPGGSTASPSTRKAAIMENILDRINNLQLGKGAVALTNANGNEKTPLHLWGFSDDDFGNFSKAASVLQAGVDQNRWPHVKISLFFTGTNHPTEKSCAVVLRPNQAPRPFAETMEWKALIQ